jgi:hypothetical protein
VSDASAPQPGAAALLAPAPANDDPPEARIAASLDEIAAALEVGDAAGASGAVGRLVGACAAATAAGLRLDQAALAGLQDRLDRCATLAAQGRDQLNATMAALGLRSRAHRAYRSDGF